MLNGQPYGMIASEIGCDVDRTDMSLMVAEDSDRSPTAVRSAKRSAGVVVGQVRILYPRSVCVVCIIWIFKADGPRVRRDDSLPLPVLERTKRYLEARNGMRDDDDGTNGASGK
jgi:hypothetical protein